MSNSGQVGLDRGKQTGSLQIGVELVRVRQRASARLGAGIGARAVQMMMSKLDGVTEKEEKRR
jgi:hypothetical protein